MRLAYIDESGVGNIKVEPYLVVTAVIVQADGNLFDIKEHLQKLVRKYIPEEHRDGFVFHATELFNGGGKLFDRKNPIVPRHHALEIIDALAAIPRYFNLSIAQAWVDREQFALTSAFAGEAPGPQTVHAHATAFMNCIGMVEIWMRKHAKKENCLTVVEDNPHVRKLLRGVQNFNQKAVLEEQDSPLAYVFPFKHIQEDPLFQPKTSANPLELADFCAYVWRRFLASPDDERWLKHMRAMRGHFVDETSILKRLPKS